MERYRLHYLPAGDVNGDGYDDVISYDDDYALRLSNTSNSNFTKFPCGGIFFSAGDVNGDGYDDGICASGNELRLFLGDTFGYNTTSSSWFAEANKIYIKIEEAEDINSDGYDDLLVASFDTLANKKYVHLYYGSINGLLFNSRILVYSDTFQSEIIELKLVGDLSQDGNKDLAIGFKFIEGYSKVILIESDSVGFTQTDYSIIAPNDSFSLFGQSITYTDVNVDGKSDLLIGAPDRGLEGEVFVYLGTEDGIASHPSYKLVKQTGDAIFSEFRNFGSKMSYIDNNRAMVLDNGGRLLFNFGFNDKGPGLANIFAFNEEDDHVTTSSNKEQYIKNISGCDSVSYNSQVYYSDTTLWLVKEKFTKVSLLEIVNISVNDPEKTTSSIVSCENYIDSDGEVITKSGTYLKTYTSTKGCDSVVEKNITILKPSFSRKNVRACKEYQSPNGKIWNKSGTFYDTLDNYLGCDSIVQINLEIGYSVETTFEINHCGPLSLQNGRIIDSSGLYSDTFATLNGCDSIINYMVTIDYLAKSIPAVSISSIAGNDVIFAIQSDSLAETIQWQSNIGFGFEDLYNAGQYNGVYTDSLLIFDINEGNQRQLFRCVVSKGQCIDISPIVRLTVLEPVRIISTSNNSDISLFPNPTNGSVTIKGIDFKNILYAEIIDGIGRSKAVTLSENMQTFIEGNAGMYRLILYLQNGETVTFNVIKLN